MYLWNSFALRNNDKRVLFKNRTFRGMADFAGSIRFFFWRENIDNCKSVNGPGGMIEWITRVPDHFNRRGRLKRPDLLYSPVKVGKIRRFLIIKGKAAFL